MIINGNMDAHYEEGVLHQELQMTIACKRYSATQMVENANQTILTLLSQNLIESIFSHSFLRAKIRRKDSIGKGYYTINLL